MTDWEGWSAVEAPALVVGCVDLGGAYGPAVVDAALVDLGVDGGLTALVDSGAVAVIDGAVELVRSVGPRQVLPPSTLRAIHAALARALPVQGPLAERVARTDHRAASTLVPDEAIAADLAQAAVDLRAVNDVAGAADRWLRAAQLSPDPNERSARLREAGVELWFLGDHAGGEAALSSALAAATDPFVIADAALNLGQLELWERGPRRALDVLLPPVDAIEATDPDRGAGLLMHAATTVVASLDADAGVRYSRRAMELAKQGTGAMLPPVQLVLALALANRGDTVEADELLGPLEQIGWMLLDDLSMPEVEHLLNILGMAATILERWETGKAFLERVVHRARSLGSSSMVALAAANLGELHWRSGHWAEGWVLISTDLPAGATQPLPNGWAAAMTARWHAAYGNEAECRELVAKAMFAAEELDAGVIRVWAAHAMGLLCLSLEDWSEAATALDRAAAAFASGGVHEPGVAWWQADHVEALWRSGRRHEAQRALARLEADAAVTSRTWALGSGARCRGITATTTDEAEAAFTESLEILGALPAPFEVARTLLARAERRLQAGAVEDGRADAAEASSIFVALGARIWNERAQQLVAGGDPLALLTDGERRVAMAVSAGRTNRQVAEELFISPHTVDYHLRAVYRKLEVTSRGQLTALIHRLSGS